MREVGAENARTIISVFENDLSSFSITEINDNTIALAIELIDKHDLYGLRSLDALQLAPALAVRNEVDLYKTADRLLNALFEQEDLPTVLP